MPKCKLCGKDFKIRFRSNEVFCSEECCKAFHGIRAKKDLYCVICGKKLSGKNKKYCGETCRRRAATLRNMEEMKELSESKDVETPKVIKKKRKPKLTLVQIAVEARKEGLSYGQYVAKYGL